MRAEKVGSDTLLAQIVQMVVEAQRSRAPIQRLADVAANWFVPAVMLVALLAFAVWATVGPEAAPGACDCQCRGGADHRLPLCAGSGHADVDHGRYRQGCRHGRADQERRGPGGDGAVDTLVVDKTALSPRSTGLISVQSVQGFEEDEVLRLVASLERASEHPWLRPSSAVRRKEASR